MSDRPLRFTFIVARYGADVLGGAERLARRVAERLVSRGHDVRVLTSCARSYVTWANERPAGTSLEDGVHVTRFAVARGRRPLDDVFKWAATLFPNVSLFSRTWIRAQGPTVPELHAQLPAEAQQRDLLVFFQLLAPTTIFGMPSVAHKSVLVPLVHNEPGINTALARSTLRLPRALLANTDEEAELIARLAGISVPPVRVVAVGLDRCPSSKSPPALPQPYITFMGRVGKLTPLLRTWHALTARQGLKPLRFAGRAVPWRDVPLVIVGERSAKAERLPNVIQTGYVDDETRWAILRGAAALINPSRYESLSLVLLEAWTAGIPVVVNARCHVTAGLVRRSLGGLAVDFEDPDTAAVSIATGLEDPDDRAELGRHGEAFASVMFVWDRVLDAYETAARTVATGDAPL